MRIFEHRIFFLAGKFAIIEQMLLTEFKKTAHAYYKHLYFSKFFGGKNKSFWTALNTSFFFERQKIVLEKVQLNRVIIFPYIFIWLAVFLREIYQFYFGPLLNLVFLFYLIHAWSIRDIHHSFCKKLKISDK